MTKYASGVPGEYMYESYGIRLYEHAATVKLRACSYQRKDCCHGSESSSAIRQRAVSSNTRSKASRRSKLRDLPQSFLKFKCGRSFECSKL